MRRRTGILPGILLIVLSLPAFGPSVAYGSSPMENAAKMRRKFQNPLTLLGFQKILLLDSILKRQKLGARKDLCIRNFWSQDELAARPLAPEQYEILAIKREALEPTRENFFPFNNRNGMQWSHIPEYGYCMSITLLQRDLNLLLWFDPKAAATYSSTAKKREFFGGLLYDAWAKRIPAVIPGFANLRAFTSDPLIQSIFERAVPRIWGELAAIPAITFGVTRESLEGISPEEIRKRVNYLEERLALGYTPVIFVGGKPVRSTGAARPPTVVRSKLDLALKASGSNIHVLQLRKILKTGPEKWELEVFDPNRDWPENRGTLLIDLARTPLDRLYYRGAEKDFHLHAFGELPGDRLAMDEIVLALRAYAEKPRSEESTL